MRITRKLEFVEYWLADKITNHKYYLCDYCHELHKTNENKIVINPIIPICIHKFCAEACITKAKMILFTHTFGL